MSVTVYCLCGTFLYYAGIIWYHVQQFAGFVFFAPRAGTASAHPGTWLVGLMRRSRELRELGS